MVITQLYKAEKQPDAVENCTHHQFGKCYSQKTLAAFLLICLWIHFSCLALFTYSWNLLGERFHFATVCLLSKTANKCTWSLTSVFKFIIPRYSVSGVTQKALKRLNRSEQEPDSMPVILCWCCFDIVWMLVKTNHLGLIEKLINRQGETKRKPMHAAFVCILNSALIWNVPAVHCAQKTAAFPKPDPGICAEHRGIGALQAPGPWGMTGGLWEEAYGQEWRWV